MESSYRYILYKYICRSLNNCLIYGCHLIAGICDDTADFTDGADEIHCLENNFFALGLTTRAKYTYTNSEGECDNPAQWVLCNQHDNICFPRNKLCLYERSLTGEPRHCPNTEHLLLCWKYECPTYFKCPESYCIPLSVVCDQVKDCPGILHYTISGCVIFMSDNIATSNKYA